MHTTNYFKANLMIYIIINILLVIINLSYCPDYIWFHFPILGWGCLLAVLYLVSSRYPSENWSCKNGKESGKDEEHKRNCLEYGKQVGFRCHLAVYLVIIVLLTIVNLQYTPHILWVIYVILGWGSGVLAHYYFFNGIGTKSR
ncbi:MAG: 2TM domain-containing protein [Oligoflexales bacterium]|nr:2TM domain-containing protein [Oligoflexales bacterium]